MAARKAITKALAVRYRNASKERKGADPDSLLDVIPDHWIVDTSKKVPDGIQFRAPYAPGQSIIYEPGWAGATDLVHAGPYLRISVSPRLRDSATPRLRDSGPAVRIPLAGNPALP